MVDKDNLFAIPVITKDVDRTIHIITKHAVLASDSTTKYAKSPIARALHQRRDETRIDPTSHLVRRLHLVFGLAVAGWLGALSGVIGP